MPETTSAAVQIATTTPRTPSRKSVSAMFLRADLAIEGTRNNPEILTALTALYNYTASDLDALAALNTSTRALFLDTLQSRADQQGSTETFKSAFTDAKKTAANFAVLCREELRGNNAALTALGLMSGRAPLALAAFLTYADTLFGNARQASADVRLILARRGYTEERLTQEQGKIAALRAANSAQESAKAKAQSLTPQQRAALDQLNHEVNKLRKYARRALAETPQLLEAIGVKA